MRTISLCEHKTQAEALTADELAQLLDPRVPVSVSPRADGSYDLRPGSRVGTVVLSSVRLLIRPKVSLPNVFFLLCYGAGLTEWDDERFPYEKDEFFSAIGRLLEAEVRHAASVGLVRDYREREESLPAIRGRIDIGAQIRRWPGQAFPLHCRYQDYGEDTEINRVIKAAIRKLLRVPFLDDGVGMELRHHLRLFAAVADVDYGASAVPELSFSRLNEAWRSTGLLAQLILRATAVRDSVGSIEGISFTVDMNKLFERFVEKVVDDEARACGWSLERQSKRHLTASVRMKPDLILRRDGLDCAVGDAKYKELEIADWPHADLYQLLAYCVALGLPRGLLIYADARRPRSEMVIRAGVTMDVLGVDLGARSSQVLARTREAARHLVHQAERPAVRTDTSAQPVWRRTKRRSREAQVVS